MIKKFNRGFTLIELLVVIAIIGILSSVVLASLNTARGKGADAAIKSNLNNTRAQAELFYDSGATYEGVCATTGTNTIGAQVNAAAKVLLSTNTLVTDATAFAYSASGAAASAACHDNALGWAAIVSLKNPGTASAGWCVDSTGFAGEVTSLPANDYSCQ